MPDRQDAGSQKEQDNMALKAMLDNLDGLSPDVAKEYKQGDDGKYRLDVTPVSGLALEDVDGLKTALAKERENARKAADAMKTFEGLDPAKARDALKKVEEMADWTPEQKVKEQLEAAKAQMADAHGKERTKLEERVKRLTSVLNQALITATATQAIAELKGSPTLLLPHVERQTRLRETDDGKFVVEVIDKDGNPRIGDSKGSAMTIAQLVEEMKSSETYARAFEGSGASGSGAGPKGTGSSSAGSFVISATDARDPAKYRAAREAASKAGQQLQIAE